MRVLFVPGRLRAATGMLSLCVLIAALETLVATRAPWWRIPYNTVTVWCSATGLICFPLAVWMAHGRRWALHASGIFGALWCVLSAWMAIRTHNPGLGFFTLGLAAFWITLYAWFRHEMGRTFFDPQLRWYEGLPKPIPGLKCEFLVKGEKKAEVRVSRIDDEGAFLFSEQVSAFDFGTDSDAEMIFSFRDRQVRCRGIPVRALGGNSGAGFLFRSMSFDQKKDLGDFVEVLRGEGHA